MAWLRSAARGAADAGRRAADTLAVHHRLTLAALVVAQWLATLVFATRVTHNGWIFYQGGDQIWYSTTAWLLGTGFLPYALIGYGWSLILLPVTWVTGSTFVAALPPVVVVQVLLLAPLATLSVFWLAARLAGRLAGLWCAALWVAAPYAAIPLFADRYHDRFVDQFLPQALGLTAMADFPSLVVLLVAAVLLLRSLDRRSGEDALLAGAVAGFALGMKPSNSLFLVGAALAYVVARRWREAAWFGAALLPAALTLALWKQRGIGELPLFALDETHVAAGHTLPLAETWFDRFVPLDWDVFRENMAQLREYFWSARLAQWAPLAGAIAIGRRSLPGAALLAGWLFAFVLVKGSSPVATIDSGSFFRLLLPAFPAFLLLAGAIPLLVPTFPRRLGHRLDPVAARPLDRRVVALTAAALALVPLVTVAVVRPLDGPQHAVEVDGILVPVDGGAVHVAARRAGAAQELTWTTREFGADVFYRVYRTAGDEPDVACDSSGAARCQLTMVLLGTTRTPTFVDNSPPAEVAYRVGIAANWRDDPSLGDVFLLSPPVAAAP